MQTAATFNADTLGSEGTVGESYLGTNTKFVLRQRDVAPQYGQVQTDPSEQACRHAAMSAILCENRDTE